MAKEKKAGLGGRGLNAIFGSDVEKVLDDIQNNALDAPGRREVELPIAQIRANPYQPRKEFDDKALRELADSIRLHGIFTPLLVRQSVQGYELIAGERRLRAAKMAGLERVPAIAVDFSDEDMMEISLLENIQRENLDPIEVAMSYQRLMEECRLTQEQMADRVGKKRASVANQLRLLKLPAKVQHDLKVGLVSVGHAKVLLGVENPALQEALCDAIVKHGLSVRQLEEKIQSLGNTKSATPKAAAEPVELPQMYYRLLENLGRYVGENSLSLRRSKDGKSAITIRFASDSQAEEFLKALDPR
jgi:ParB family chromosome partitioning protein